MISENLSHDSKVWTKEYDLEGNLLEELGCKITLLYCKQPGARIRIIRAARPLAQKSKHNYSDNHSQGN